MDDSSRADYIRPLLRPVLTSVLCGMHATAAADAPTAVLPSDLAISTKINTRIFSRETIASSLLHFTKGSICIIRSSVFWFLKLSLDCRADPSSSYEYCYYYMGQDTCILRRIVDQMKLNSRHGSDLVQQGQEVRSLTKLAS